MDEPTAGLDPIASSKMMDLFKKLHQEGKTIILVTHQMDHVLKYCNRVIVFDEGEIKKDTTPMNLFKDFDEVKRLNLDVPSIVYLVNKLTKKYPKLANYEIKSIDDFVNAYKEVISL